MCTCGVGMHAGPQGCRLARARGLGHNIFLGFRSCRVRFQSPNPAPKFMKSPSARQSVFSQLRQYHTFPGDGRSSLRNQRGKLYLHQSGPRGHIEIDPNQTLQVRKRTCPFNEWHTTVIQKGLHPLERPRNLRQAHQGVSHFS